MIALKNDFDLNPVFHNLVQQPSWSVDLPSGGNSQFSMASAVASEYPSQDLCVSLLCIVY